MSAPSRRTIGVRIAQMLLIVLFGWLAMRPVAGSGSFDWSDFTLVDPTGRFNTETQFGDPLPWLRGRVRSSDPAFWYMGGRQPTPDDFVVRRDWRVTDPFAPLVGLLLALAVPPLVAGRLAAPRRWSRWPLVAGAAGIGGLVTGVTRTVLFGVPVLYGSTVPGSADYGMIGYVVERTATGESVTFLRHAADGLWRSRRESAPPAVLVGLVSGGVLAAGALRPWRSRPEGPS